MAEAKKKVAIKKPKTTKAKEVKEAEILVEASPIKDAASRKPRIESKKPDNLITTDTQVLETSDAQLETKVAKAGKRSAKAVAEVEEKHAKEERKTTKAAADTKEAPKQTKKPTRTREERAGKKYREVAKLIEKDKIYSLAEALELSTKTSITKFDATVELHINLGVDPRQADQNVRDTVVLPAGTGKNVRVAVFAEADDIIKAKKAGADIAAGDELLQQLDKEQMDFDVLIASPSLMPRLGKYARMLGPRGLMPNPKSGTVTTDVATAVKEAKAGRVEYRVDQAGIIHVGIGKISFGAAKLAQNAEALLTSVRSSKPASLKGPYIKAIYVSTTMGPSIKTENK